MAFVPSIAQGALFLFVVVLVCTTSGSGSIFPSPMVLPPPTASPKSCPLYSTKAGFNLEKVVTTICLIFNGKGIILFVDYLEILL